MYGLDFHADDYAASPDNSRRILALLQSGRVDSISVIPNMSCCAECMQMLRESWDLFPRKPLLSLHINLIDGTWLSSRPSKELMRNSWGRIFLRGFLPGRKQLRRRLSGEIEAQLTAFLNETGDLKDDRGNPLPLRIDSHVHTHMIPLVFQALTEALNRAGLLDQVRFIRCSTEPLYPFLFTSGVTGTLSIVSIIKNQTLHFLSHFVRSKLSRMQIPTGRVFGIAMTGEMDLRRVRLLMPKMTAYARKKDAYLEILSHPGRCIPSEISDEYGPDDRKAYLSAKRDVEFDMLMEIPRSDLQQADLPGLAS